jgi:hypothetical protein
MPNAKSEPKGVGQRRGLREMRFQDAFFLHRAAYDGLRASRLRMQKLSKYAKLCYRRLISVGCGVHIKDAHDRQSDDTQ